MSIEEKLTELEKRILNLEILAGQKSDNRCKEIQRFTKMTERENPAFDLFWNSYPHRLGRKVNKKSAKRAFCRQDKKDIPLIMQAVSNYSDSLTGLDEYSQNAWKWLSEENWRAYLE